jgi:phospholipid transport system substrate-binding protein
MSGAALLATAPLAHAARNAEAEAYVQTNATQALASLRPGGSSQQFYTLMSQFADMPRIANFVLGRYGAQLRTDAALRTEWTRTFQDYAIAVYQARLDRFSGATIRVTGSIERVAGRDVIVVSEITPRGGGRATPVQWRLLRTGNVWKVVDVSLVLEGNEIWLAQQQQRDFLAALDQNQGDIRALMTTVRQSTASLRQRTARG